MLNGIALLLFLVVTVFALRKGSPDTSNAGETTKPG